MALGEEYSIHLGPSKNHRISWALVLRGPSLSEVLPQKGVREQRPDQASWPLMELGQGWGRKPHHLGPGLWPPWMHCPPLSGPCTCTSRRGAAGHSGWLDPQLSPSAHGGQEVGGRSVEGALAGAASHETRGRARSPLLHYVHGALNILVLLSV